MGGHWVEMTPVRRRPGARTLAPTAKGRSPSITPLRLRVSRTER